MNFNTKQKNILVVDDIADNLMFIAGLLKDKYRVQTFKNPKSALEYISKNTDNIDLILLDIMMPELSGYDVIKILKEDEKTKEIPVIFLTAMNNLEDEQKGLEMGASDYITKPIFAQVMLSRVKTQLENKAAKDFLKDKNDYLEEEVKKRTKEMSKIQDITILMLASLAETRDSDTGNHLRRTQHYIKILAQSLKQHPKFNTYLNDGMIETLFRSAPLHDIGKVGIADRILLKPCSLTEDEFEIMKTHTVLGKNSIENVEQEVDMKVDFLEIAKQIAFSHHENYDGSGYPMGFKAEEIPISARLMAIADVYDAITSARVYKEAMSHQEALDFILINKSVKFDPDMVEAFLNRQDEFIEISKKYADSKLILDEKREQISKIINFQG